MKTSKALRILNRLFISNNRNYVMDEITLRKLKQNMNKNYLNNEQIVQFFISSFKYFTPGF